MPGNRRSWPQAALDGHGLPEWRIQEQLGEGRITTRDPRCGLVTPELYAAVGGRVETDLFGELPPVLLDPDRLTRAWLKRVQPLAALFEAEGLSVRPCPGDEEAEGPDEMERLFYAYGGLSEAETVVYREARDRAQAAADAAEAALAGAGLPADGASVSGDEIPGVVEAFVRARIAQDQAGAGQRLVVLVVLRPSLRTGLDVDCYAPVEAEIAPEPAAGAEDRGEGEETGGVQPGGRTAYLPPQADAAMPETEGVSHVLHAIRTDTATRGLIRALVGAPSVALTVLIARLFTSLAVWPPMPRSESALAITATWFAPAGGRIIPGLDGVVREQLDERRRAWEASGQTAIAWIHGLETEDRFGLMAELTALCLDLHESRTDHVRRAARAEAAEIAALCDADLSRWWTPDGAYLRPHSREQLLSMLDVMGAGTEAAARLRKGDLVAWTEDQAAARSWTPGCLAWARDPGRSGADEDAAAAGTAKGAATAEAEGEDVEGEDPGQGLPDPAEAGGMDDPAEDPGPDVRDAEAAGVGAFMVTAEGEAALRDAAA